MCALHNSPIHPIYRSQLQNLSKFQLIVLLDNMHRASSCYLAIKVFNFSQE